uniref:Uncharacterized alpha/beta hydrolase domain (DUF2235) n=1 Tax=Candidatus Kentrum sp. LFY TaxID=2126342 RepID=A0A450WI32_9GAMM|nr:MAG: Uncharacterized alpha/beta hydrolase domain (DUF2235) [Candidatus Kentron sp. LFY]
MKKIILCFDGTCCHPSDARQEREWFGLGDMEDSGITNVLKMHLLLGGGLDNDSTDPRQRSFYYSGVGTHGNACQRVFNMIFAPDNQDVAEILNLAGADLNRVFEPGDEIFLFGFSRGAALARRFAAIIPRYLPDGVDPTEIVRFMGVFDTVASIGVPNLSEQDRPVSDVLFENGTLSPHVFEALHLLALDECRLAFRPTLMNADPRVTEIWFPGGHSDVGGGFWNDGLSDVTLRFMLDEIVRREFGLAILDPIGVDYEHLVDKTEGYRIDPEDVFIDPKSHGKIHLQDRWGPIAEMTLGTREVRVATNDNFDDALLPMVHSTMWDRFAMVDDYRPRALKGVAHWLLDVDGDMERKNGLMDYIR